MGPSALLTPAAPAHAGGPTLLRLSLRSAQALGLGRAGPRRQGHPPRGSAAWRVGRERPLQRQPVQQAGPRAVGAVGAVGPAVVTDANVPVGHQGLHGFLYGDSGADVHDAEVQGYEVREGEDDGGVAMPAAEFVASRQGRRLPGLYGVYDAEGVLQFVGFSRNLVLAVQGHRSKPQTAPLTCSVRVRVFRDPAMVSRSRLDSERQLWMAELAPAGVPPGNREASLHLWEGGVSAAAGAMTEQERAEYEEKKLKMRKAMGENLHDDQEGETLDAKQRRLALLQAVEGDDWSAVIDQQTHRTLNGASAGGGIGALEAAAPAAAGGEQERAAEAGKASALSLGQATAGPSEQGEEEGGAKASPFAAGQAAAGAGSAGAGQEEEDEFLEMSVGSVDAVLNAVRPYLIADGGNVEVVSVGGGVVDLALQGACGSCPSATTTMKMGIERVLREKFGPNLVEVREVGGALGLGSTPTVELVDAHLDILRPAIRNFKGFVEVVRVDSVSGVCEVKYSGPAPVGMGIQAAIKDKFPSLTNVTLIAP